MIKFCQRMGWGMLAAVLDHMCDRLKAGARADLLEMAQVTYVKSRTARVLWENGLKSVRALAEADVNDLVPVLLQVSLVEEYRARQCIRSANRRQAQPSRKLRLQGEEAEKYRSKLLLKAEIIVKSASRVWGEFDLLMS